MNKEHETTRRRIAEELRAIRDGKSRFSPETNGYFLDSVSSRLEIEGSPSKPSHIRAQALLVALITHKILGKD